jgi:acyl carrier protein
VAEIFAEILRVEGVGAHENFFDLGGHSLLATRVISRLRDRLARELPLRLIFESPTVTELARALEKSDSSPVPTPPAAAGFFDPAPRRGRRRAALLREERLWFLDRMDPGRSVYNVPEAVRLRGPLRLPALERALAAILDRHDVLRTSFEEKDGQPVRRVEKRSLSLAITDLSALPEALRRSEAERLARKESGIPFALDRAPLLRARLLRLSPEEHWLVLTMHHIASDGWSSRVFFRELQELYAAAVSGREPALPELPIQYADFAKWQREWLRGEVLESQLAYWKERLAGEPRLLELPTDHPRPTARNFAGATARRRFSPALRASLESLSRREGASLFMTLLAAFQVLLGRLTGQEDVLVGTPVAGRSRTETENLIGCFVNTLVMRGDLSGNPTFREFLGRVRETALGAYDHQDLPFEKLVAELRPNRDLGQSPLFQAMLSFGTDPVTSFEMGGVEVEPLDVDADVSTFDVSLDMAEVEGGLQASMEYSTELFDRETVERWLESLEVLLEGIVEDAGGRIWELAVMREEEKKRLLEEWDGGRDGSG